MTVSLSDQLVRVADELASHADRFTELDAAAGDGDLGLTVARICDAIREVAPTLQQPTDDAEYKQALLLLGRAIATRAPSTFGTLVGSSVLAAAAAMDPLDAGRSRPAAAAAAAVENVRRRGRSDVGERTLLDALVPAAEVLSANGDLAAAADAAEAGAAATAEMDPKHGRAAWIGERAKGLPDAGATVIAAFFRAAAGA